MLLDSETRAPHLIFIKLILHSGCKMLRCVVKVQQNWHKLITAYSSSQP